MPSNIIPAVKTSRVSLVMPSSLPGLEMPSFALRSAIDLYTSDIVAETGFVKIKDCTESIVDAMMGCI